MTGHFSRVKLAKIRTDSLAVHPTVQRQIQSGWLKKLTDNLDLDALDIFHAVDYPINGKRGPYIIDGQHRYRALIERGMGEWEVDVKIYLDVKSDKRAAELIKLLNTRRAFSPFDMYLQEVKAGDVVAAGVDDIIRKHGLQMSRQCGDGLVACPATAKKCYRIDDGRSFDDAFGITGAAWGKRAEAHDGKVLEGICLVLSRNNGNLDRAALAKKLSKYPGGPSSLLGDARGRSKYHRGSVSRAIAATIIDTYNLGRRAERLESL